MRTAIDWLKSAMTSCLACGEAFADGELVLPDVSGDWIHAACCGPEREGYVKDTETGEPLGTDDAIPTGDPWPIVADHDDRRLKAVLDVLGERLRQVEGEGWTPEHDDEHEDGVLARGAAGYAYFAALDDEARSESCALEPRAGWFSILRGIWPPSWGEFWWKPRDRRRDLVRAGALILAEIERLDRAESRGQ